METVSTPQPEPPMVWIGPDTDERLGDVRKRMGLAGILILLPPLMFLWLADFPGSAIGAGRHAARETSP